MANAPYAIVGWFETPATLRALAFEEERSPREGKPEFSVQSGGSGRTVLALKSQASGFPLRTYEGSSRAEDDQFG